MFATLFVMGFYRFQSGTITISPNRVVVQPAEDSIGEQETVAPFTVRLSNPTGLPQKIAGCNVTCSCIVLKSSLPIVLETKESTELSFELHMGSNGMRDGEVGSFAFFVDGAGKSPYVPVLVSK